MERHFANAEQVAEYLTGQGQVLSINYAGLPDSRGTSGPRSTAAGKGYGSVLAFEIEGGLEAGKRFVEALELHSHVANIGDVRSLVIHPASTTHSQLTPEEQLATGVDPGLVRLCVGTRDDRRHPRRPRQGLRRRQGLTPDGLPSPDGGRGATGRSRTRRGRLRALRRVSVAAVALAGARHRRAGRHVPPHARRRRPRGHQRVRREHGDRAGRRGDRPRRAGDGVHLRLGPPVGLPRQPGRDAGLRRTRRVPAGVGPALPRRPADRLPPRRRLPPGPVRRRRPRRHVPGRPRRRRAGVHHGGRADGDPRVRDPQHGHRVPQHRAQRGARRRRDDRSARPVRQPDQRRIDEPGAARSAPPSSAPTSRRGGPTSPDRCSGRPSPSS